MQRQQRIADTLSSSALPLSRAGLNLPPQWACLPAFGTELNSSLRSPPKGDRTKPAPFTLLALSSHTIPSGTVTLILLKSGSFRQRVKPLVTF